MATRSRRPLRTVTPPTDPAAVSAAFDDLYQHEWSGIVALGWSLTGSWASSEELAQDAFADAYRRWDEISRLDRPGAWVRRAVINRSASYHRSRGAEQRGLERWSTRAAKDADGPGADRTGDGATDQVGDPAFWAAVRSLPERQMACVALHYLEDRSVAEIAAVLGCRPATVKVHLHRGRLALAERLRAPEATDAPTSQATAAVEPLHARRLNGLEQSSPRATDPTPADRPHCDRRPDDRPAQDRPLDDRGEEAR